MEADCRNNSDALGTISLGEDGLAPGRATD